MLRIGVVGCGRIGQVHALSIQQTPHAELVAVADASMDVSGAAAQRFGVESRDVGEILSARDIDAVVIATSTATHFDMIQAAASARKAIFCEKPFPLPRSERLRHRDHPPARSIPLSMSPGRR